MSSVKAEWEKKERELDQVYEDLNHAQERLQLEEAEKKEREEEVKALRAELSTVAERVKKEEPEDVEMGGFRPPSGKTVDAATNTEKRTYAQAAVQAQVEGKPEVTPPVFDVSSDKGKKPEATSV